MASSPVPAEGSSTRSPGVTAAATRAQKPKAIGVENCCSAWLSSERRVWVGERPAILVSIGSSAAGERRAPAWRGRIYAGTAPSPPRRRHRPFSSPRRLGRRSRQRRIPSRRAASAHRRVGPRSRAAEKSLRGDEQSIGGQRASRDRRGGKREARRAGAWVMGNSLGRVFRDRTGASLSNPPVHSPPGPPLPLQATIEKGPARSAGPKSRSLLAQARLMQPPPGRGRGARSEERRRRPRSPAPWRRVFRSPRRR